MRITTRRIALCLVLLVVTVGSFFLSKTPASLGETVIIEVKGNAVYKGLLSEDRKITIKATYGLVRIQIKGNKVAVVAAECPNRICVRAGWRSHTGESILCTPNELVIRILGKQDHDRSGYETNPKCSMERIPTGDA